MGLGTNGENLGNIQIRPAGENLEKTMTFFSDSRGHLIVAWVARDEQNIIIYQDTRRPPVDITEALEKTHKLVDKK